jgi:hypothetical protein
LRCRFDRAQRKASISAQTKTEFMHVFGYALYLAQTGEKHAQAKLLQDFGSARILEVVEDCPISRSLGLRLVLFEACSAFTRVTACTLALSEYFVTR